MPVVTADKGRHRGGISVGIVLVEALVTGDGRGLWLLPAETEAKNFASSVIGRTETTPASSGFSLSSHIPGQGLFQVEPVELVELLISSLLVKFHECHVGERAGDAADERSGVVEELAERGRLEGDGGAGRRERPSAAAGTRPRESGRTTQR